MPPWPPPSPRCRGRRELEVGREKGGSSRPGGRREGVGGWRGKRAALTAGRPPPSAAGESRGREIFSFFSFLLYIGGAHGMERWGAAKCAVGLVAFICRRILLQ